MFESGQPPFVSVCVTLTPLAHADAARSECPCKRGSTTSDSKSFPRCLSRGAIHRPEARLCICRGHHDDQSTPVGSATARRAAAAATTAIRSPGSREASALTESSRCGHLFPAPTAADWFNLARPSDPPASGSAQGTTNIPVPQQQYTRHPTTD